MPEEDNEKLKEEKRLIRAILIAAKDGLTLREFENDCLDIIGKTIPYAEYGFSTLKAFLQSLRDVVQFVRDGNGEEKLKYVSDATTKHIENLVAKQRPSAKKKKGRPKSGFSGYGARGGRGGGSVSRGGRGFYHPQPRGRQSLLGIPYMNMGPRTTNPPFTCSFMNKPPSGFRNTETSYPRPPRYTVPSVNQSQLHSASDVYSRKITKSPEAAENERSDERPAHSRSISTRSQSHCLDSGRSPQTQSQTYRDNLYQTASGNCDNQHYSEQRRVDSDTDYDQTQQNFSAASSSSGGRMRQLRGRYRGRVRAGYEKQHEAEYGGQFDGTRPRDSGALWSTGQEERAESYWSHHDYEYDAENCNSDDEDTEGAFVSSEDTCEIHPNVQDKVRQVLVKAPRGLWCNRLPVMYKEMFQQELPVREQGFHSVIEFVSAMPHIVRTERPYDKGDWLLSDATQPRDGSNDLPLCYEGEDELSGQQQQPSQMKQTENSAAVARDEELKESVRQVLQAHTDGVALYQFAEVYQEMTGRELDPEAYGEKDMSGLLVLLSHAGVLRMEYLGPDAMFSDSSRLYATPTSDVRRFNYLRDGYKPHSFEVVYAEKPTDTRFPEDVVGPAVCYRPATLDDLEKNQYYEMHVSNVISPGLFWVQKRKDLLALETLMDGLEVAYKEMGERYRMPEDLMVRGQVCATLFPEDDNWHRGIITGWSHRMVEVYYVDYGNTCCVPPNSIRFLKKLFLTLPAQAIQAKLAYLLPPAGAKTFTRESKQALLDLVMSRPLMALISDIQNHVLSLVLADTNGANDVFINDKLVEDGHAIFLEGEDKAQAGKEEAAAGQDTTTTTTTVLTPACAEGQRFVRHVDCTPEFGFHVINLDGSLYLTSAEVSSLFWEEDILAAMLQQSDLGVPVPKVVVSRKQCPALFQELFSYGVYYIDHSTEALSLYALDCLPLLLDMFGNQSSTVDELKEFIVQHLKAFDPADPYWKGLDEETMSAAVSSGTDTAEEHEPEDVLTMEELQLALHSMQINRKRILKRMTSETDCLSEDIMELENTEESISTIQGLIQTLEEKQTTDTKVPYTGRSASKPSTAKTVAPLPKNLSSFSTSEQPVNVKTNVVAPMVKPPPSPPCPSAISQGLSTFPIDLAQGQTSLEQMAATNQKLEELIRQQDQMISSMLGLGVGEVTSAMPVANNPGQSQLIQNPGQPSLIQNPVQPPVIQNPGQPPVIQNPGQPQAIHIPGQPQAIHIPGQPQVIHNLGQPQMIHNPSQPQVIQNPGQPQVIHNPGQPQVIQNTTQPHTIQNLNQPQLLHNASRPQMIQNPFYPQPVPSPSQTQLPSFSLGMVHPSAARFPRPAGMPPSLGAGTPNPQPLAELPFQPPSWSLAMPRGATHPMPVPATSLQQQLYQHQLQHQNLLLHHHHHQQMMGPALESASMPQPGTTLATSSCPVTMTTAQQLQGAPPAELPQFYPVLVPPPPSSSMHGALALHGAQPQPQPGTSNPGLPLPSTSNPGLPIPSTSNPGFPYPSPSNPGLFNPGLFNPGFSNLSTSNPGIPNPSTSSPGQPSSSSHVNANLMSRFGFMGAGGVPGTGDGSDDSTVIVGQGQAGGSQLLPGMLPLLQSLKASCVVKPATTYSSSSSK